MQATSNDANNGSFAVIDVEYLLEVSGGDEELATELLADFIELFPGQLAEVEAAAGAADAAATRATAHRLKGSCMAVGANPLGELLRIAEDAAREGNVDSVAALCSQARESFAELAAQAESLDRALRGE